MQMHSCDIQVSRKLLKIEYDQKMIMAGERVEPKLLPTRFLGVEGVLNLQ